MRGSTTMKIIGKYKISIGFEQLFASLGLQTPLKLKGNSIASKANSQQATVHWLWEITKAKLSQTELSLDLF